ncbi:phosphate ABC transporter, permease protein PstA [Paenibacillus sp. SSG-1]|jgi:phosphate transport system permease protein|uniref:Phosphate transport system permease protein PstA n=2 Tax=Paenibacillus TaxID=44249 RepID=A0ABQ4LNE0_9BACL|nr:MULTISPECIES: phosphate ABC transporter permease PstA [Paenibacillus]MBJ9992219.1 phosphate ABC transporter permease PstA [Paenibacillus sp. S28]MEC0175944.1 phosphate ABC transporter permease PstA [Paenibacillus favisporus]OXL85233.1 phosphate ABC transporter, permease protein PstA [Paenibacillus sp. SSG-1]GIO58023.1 phosphate transport system permease protein PstA [Paenibacillus cineris]GIO64481.1 phosphate transport system permease protein PstA [Paenibacillus cineris]
MSEWTRTRKMQRSLVYDRLATYGFYGLGILVLLLIFWLLLTILGKGLPGLSLEFLMKLPEDMDPGGGIGPVLFNSFYILILSLLISVPIGVGAGIYMAEYAPPNKFTEVLRICVESLSSVPSIVFGMLGLAIFAEYFQIGLTILGGAVSLAFLNLPMLARVTEEAVRAVQNDVKNASYALGMTKFQCIRTVVIPMAMQGIVTGICLVAGRAFGESAVILLTAGLSTSGEMWDFNLFSPGETLAVHLWYVQSEAIVEDARQIADKSAAVLVIVVLLMNLLFRIPLWISNRRLKK